MASTTAEVLLYFGASVDSEFGETVDKLRFLTDPPMETREIIDLISPVWQAGYDDGWMDRADQE